MVVVLPGDVVPTAAPTASALKLGPGVLPTLGAETRGSVTATSCGALGHIPTKQKRHDAPGTSVVHGWYVESAARRYVPQAGDRVIGQVTNRGMESYTVTLWSAQAAALPVLAFEGATRRNRPNLDIGALVYARVVRAEPWTEPELSCVDATSGKSDGLEELKAAAGDVAMVWPVSLGLARSLLRPQHALLRHVAAHFSFEAVVGANGLVWVRTATPAQAVALGHVLRAADDHGRAHAYAGDDAPETLPRRSAAHGGLDAAEVARLVREAGV